MKKALVLKRIAAIILSVILLISSGIISAFAQDSDFSYYFANEQMTHIYITGYSGEIPSDGYIIIPSSIKNFTVSGIAANAFAGMPAIEGIVIPHTVSYIDPDAFSNSGEIAVLYPEQYEDYKNSVENDNWNETDAQDFIMNGTTIIGYRGNDNVITIPESCTEIADGVFKNKKDITTVYFHSNVTRIGKDAFKNCRNLTAVIPDSGTTEITIGANAFEDTLWQNNFESNFVTLGNTLVKYKGEETDIAIPNVLTAVADGAFAGCDIISVRIPVTMKVFGSNKCFSISENGKDYPVVYVYADSYAERYCKDNGIFSLPAAMPGDANENGTITASDARYVLRVSARLDKPANTERFKEIADINGDSIITATDARFILRIAANLEDFSSEDLLRMPRSAYEILHAASNAVSYANEYNCGYTKFAYQEISQADMNKRTAKNLGMFEDELTSADKAETKAYKKGAADAKENFFSITLADSDKIKSCTSVLSDNYYIFTITLNDEDSKAEAYPYTHKMFPVESAEHFSQMLSKKNWADKLSWDMTYTDCTLEIKVERETGVVSYAVLSMNYSFEMSGKTGNTAVTNADGTSDLATATRTDIIRYTNFEYYD